MQNGILPRGFVYIFYLLFLSISWSCHMHNDSKQNLKAPMDEGDEMESRKKQYFELLHRTNPQADWKSIEIENRKLVLASKENLIKNGASKITESFANGKINANWYEIGSNNLAGNIQGVDYFPPTDNLYCISDGGTLWRSSRTNPNWTVLNQQYQFSPRLINVIAKKEGGTKILASANRNIYYSNNEGAQFTAATGIDFPVGWGGNKMVDIITLNDVQKTVYCLTHTWDPAPFQPRFWLYRSVDTGKTFVKIKTFDAYDEKRMSLWSPQGTDKLYAIEVQNTGGNLANLYAIFNDNVSLLNSSADIPLNRESILQGYSNGSSNVFYLLVNNNIANTREVYQSNNNGLNWSLKGSLLENYAGGFAVAPSSHNRLFMGGVSLFRSFNAGEEWAMVNNWFDYYNNADKLHADIMMIKFFKTISGNEFAIINTHGGTYLSNDYLITTSNISLSNFNTGQFYDVITNPNNAGQIFGGTQDQGFQRYLGPNAPITSPINFLQVLPGDFGQLKFTQNASHLWIEYPGGEFYFYNNITANQSSNWLMPGTNKPNKNWLLPSANTSNPLENSIYVGGGNLNGGDGSYLIKLTAAVAEPYVITATQFSYNFRANSNNGSSGISSIATSSINSDNIYLATEDGTFFFSNDNGINWVKSTFTGIPGGFWLYGASIFPSKLNANTIWYAGSGYSNPGVFKSTDGGISFTAMSNGLPSTLVHEIVANESETLLFAATEAGPYVYVVEDNNWYSLHGISTPVQDYFTVEYLPATKTARFGTFGRGIWDFAINSTALPVKFENITASMLNNQSAVAVTWTVTDELNVASYNVQRSADGVTFNTIAIQSATQTTGRKKYEVIDRQLSHPQYYYRVEEVDKDGKTILSKTVAIRISVGKSYKIWPTVVNSGTGIIIQSVDKNQVLFKLFDISGKLVVNKIVQPGSLFYLPPQLAKGLYSYQLITNRQIVNHGTITIQ
jgi:hypothetical protein